MMALGQAMRQRRAESKQRQKAGALKSMLEANVELGPEGPKLNKPGFLSSLARSGMTQEALEFQSQFQAEEDKKLEAMANKNRMISKRQGEIYKENEPYLRAISDAKERGKIVKDQFTRENIPYNGGDEITDEQLESFLKRGDTDPSFAPIQDREGNWLSYNRRSGTSSNMLGADGKPLQGAGNFKETEVQLEDGRIVKAILDTKTGRYNISKFGGDNPTRIDGQPSAPVGSPKDEEMRIKREQLRLDREKQRIDDEKKVAEINAPKLKAEAAVAKNDEETTKLVENIDLLIKHPGLKGMTGTVGMLPNVPGSQTTEAETYFDNIKSSSSLSALIDLKSSGGTLGALSDSEGKLLADAASRLNKKLSHADMVKALNDYKTALIKANNRIKTEYGKISGGGIPSPKSKAEYDKLPSGAKYQKDGVVRVKK